MRNALSTVADLQEGLRKSVLLSSSPTCSEDDLTPSSPRKQKPPRRFLDSYLLLQCICSCLTPIVLQGGSPPPLQGNPSSRAWIYPARHRNLTPSSLPPASPSPLAPAHHLLMGKNVSLLSKEKRNMSTGPVSFLVVEERYRTSQGVSSGLFPEGTDSWKDQFPRLALVLRHFMIVQSNHLTVCAHCLGARAWEATKTEAGLGEGCLVSKGQEGLHDLCAC